MKKTIICCIVVFVFVVGIIIGRHSTSPTIINISLSHEQEELSKWKDIEKSRTEQAEEVFKRAAYILHELEPFDQNSYSKGDLHIDSWGEIFSDTGIEIYYKDELVFDATSGFFSDVGEINAFKPGKWLGELQLIDVQKEKAIKETEKLKKAYSTSST